MGALRSVLLVAVVVLNWPIDVVRAQTDDLEGGIHFAPNTARRVTLIRDGALMASFEVPEGTWLSAAYDDEQPSSITAGRREFHGNFELRALPLCESPPRSGGRRMEEVMREELLVLTVQDVDVVVENVAPWL